MLYTQSATIGWNSLRSEIHFNNLTLLCSALVIKITQFRQMSSNNVINFTGTISILKLKLQLRFDGHQYLMNKMKSIYFG